MTPNQAKALALMADGLTKAEAARRMGMDPANFGKMLLTAQARQREAEQEPEGVAEALGRLAVQGAKTVWIKTAATKDAPGVSARWDRPKEGQDPTAILDAIREGLADIKAEPIPRPVQTPSGLMCLFPVADLHFGLHTDPREVGEAWGIAKAKQVFTETFQSLVDVTPAADVAVLAQLGDLLHANDHRNVTPGHEHRLDVDGRLYQAIRAATAAMKGAIEALRRKYPRVIYHGLPGNHDETVQVGVTVALAEFYSDCPDVEIVENEARIHKREWGRNLIVLHHGDRVKPDQMPQFAAAEWAEEWGRTRYRLALSGHIHTPTMKPRGGMDCETVGTIIPRDGYAWSNGYSDRRELVSITIKESGGWVTRGRMPAAA